jgi:hypothetical protein
MKTKTKVISIVLSISALMILVSCQQQKAEWKGTIEEVDGVKVIKNPNEPLYGEITYDLEEDLSIGNEEDENYMFYRASFGGVDSDGNILVLDRGDSRIKKYDKDGKFMYSIGRQGQGPGEFEQILTLSLDSDNNIYVMDSGRYKVHIFNKDGEFKNSITLTRFIAGEFGIIKQGSLIAQTLSRGERKSDMPMDYDSFHNIDLISQEGTTIKTVASFLWETPPMIKIGRGFTSPNNYCTPRLCLCPINEDLAIYGYSSDYSLFAINSKGETVYIVKKDEPPQPVSKAEKNEIIDRRMRRQKENERMPKISRSRWARALKFPKYKPFYTIIIKDDKDRIYVRKFEFPLDRSDVADFDMFNKEGYFLYKVKIPISYPVIKNGCIYTTERDQDTGYAKIKRYKIKNWEQIKEGI